MRSMTMTPTTRSPRAWARTCMTAVALALVAGCGGGGGAGVAAGGGDGTAPPPAGDSALKAAASGEVLAYFRKQVGDRAAAGLEGTSVSLPGTAVVFSPAPAFSGTPLQEQGVDEDDRLKTDGQMLYALHAARVDTPTPQADRLGVSRIQADGNLQDLGSISLRADWRASGLFLAEEARRLAVLSSKSSYGPIQPALPAVTSLIAMPTERSIALDVYGVQTGALPAAQARMEIDGWLVASRRIGNVLYLVSSWTPDLSAWRVPANSTPAQVSTTLATLTAEALLPKVRVNGGAAQPLVAETDCYVQPANATLGLQLTTITAIDLASGSLQRASRCFVGDGSAVYMSPANVYIASSQQVWIAAAFTATVFPRETTTDIHKFALDGLGVTYRASGQVPGHLGWDAEKMPYRMSEHNGDLRVLTYTGDTGWSGSPQATPITTARPSPATLTVLRENAAARSLQAVASLPNGRRPAPLGHEGEQVYAVHFAGPRAYVVTFRRTDPLYVLDLSDAADPKAVGELVMPGYSEVLRPIANGNWLVGIGRDASTSGVVEGLKVALFDVRNPAAPRVAASISLGGRGSTSALDGSRHGVNILEAGGQARIALPARLTEASTSGFSSVATQGLTRFVADTGAGTLVQQATVVATRFDGTVADAERYARYDVTTERSVQSTLGAYYLSGGEVRFAPAP